MATINKLLIRRGTNLSNAGTPEAGELIFDSGNTRLYIGDGSTAATGLTAIGGNTFTTAAVSNGATTLATGDHIYDHVTTRISGLTSNTGTVDTTGSPVDNDYAKFTDANTLEGRSYAELAT